MGNIEINQMSSTVTVGLVIIATALSGGIGESIARQYSAETISEHSYIPDSNSSTFSENEHIQQNSINNIQYNDSFEKSISQFYAELEVKQEPLGDEFEKVLYDNLWDLYES